MPSRAARSSVGPLSLQRACEQAARALVERLEDRWLLSTAPLRPDHIVVVIESDRFANALGDTANMPYVNQLAAGGLVFPKTQGINTSAQGGEMNYLALYSGSSQGITDNGRGYTFAGANLAQSLNSTAGLSFTGFSESLVSDGSQVQQVSDGVHPDLYTRNHNPMAMFTNGGAGKTNADVNKTFNSFKAFATQTNTYANLPTVSFVIPNNLNNTNGSNEAAPYATDLTAYSGLRQSADTWLKQNLDGYVQWAKTHNSLLLIVGDSGDRQHNFAVGTETIITGDPRLFVPGTDTNTVNHFNTLRTIEDMYGQSPLGSSATATGLDTNAAGQLAAPGVQLGTTAALASSANPSVFGQAVTLTATIAPTASSPNKPSGVVTFKDGATTLGTGTLSASGVATFATSALSVASHSISAVYAGDANFNTSTSAVLSQVVNQSVTAATSTVVTSSVNSAVFGQPVTLTATVTPTGPGTPTGSITFLDGAATLGTGTLNASGVATFWTSTLPVAAHSITVVYAGDANFAGGTSAALSLSVNQSATSATVSASVNPAVFGQAVTFTATIIAAAPGAGRPTGAVTFMDGAISLGTGVLNSSGVAIFSTSSLAVATHSITAVYAGDVNFQSSASPPVSEVIQPASTTTAVSSSANPASLGQPINFTAIVAVTLPGAGAPTGSVQFIIDGANFGSPVPLSGGAATFASVTSLSAGNHTISAIYLGNGSFTTSTAPALAQTVGQASMVRPDHVVILIEEDRAANAIGDTLNMPYLNQLASTGLVYSNSHGLNDTTQFGEMNYLALFSGSTQGITDDGRGYSFTGPNLAQALNNTSGLSFAGYVESLPTDGSQVQQAGDATRPDIYMRSYNPMAMFTNVGAGKTNADVNKTFNSFTALATQANTYANLPAVSFVLPNNLDNTHGSNEAPPYATDPSAYVGLRQTADTWLKTNLDAYVQWAKTHNSLLIITGDEGDRANNFANGVTTIVTGDPRLFVPGVDGANVNHYNTLRTIEDMYGIAPLGNSAAASHLDINALGQLAAPAGQAATTTSLASSANPSLAGQSVTFTATVTGSGAPSGSVTFKDGSTILGSAALNTSGVATLTTSALSVASHTITAVYSGDSTFKTSTSANLAQTVTQPAAPMNDSFANRITIAGASATMTGTNVNATKETGEPNHAGNSGGKSVWWTWTAPASGTVTIDTTGSNFDTLLATYTGSTVSALTAVTNGSNDDNPAGGTTTSLVTFPVTAGTVYQIAVDGYNGLSGNITLQVNLAVAAPGAPASVAASNATFTDRVRITWAASLGATGYQVWRSTTNNSSSAILLTSTDVTGTLFDDLTAVSGTTYFYWIKAKNTGGVSGFSAVASGKRA